MALIEKLTAIADEVRGKTGGTELLTLDEIAAAICGISVGGNAVQIGRDAPSPSFINLFHALEQGTAKTGTFTLANALSGETLIFSSGLESLTGFMLIDVDRTESLEKQEGVWVSIGLLTAGDIAFSFVLNTSYIASAGGVAPRVSSYRFDGGDLFLTPAFAGNKQYTPFRVGETYCWVAW